MTVWLELQVQKLKRKGFFVQGQRLQSLVEDFKKEGVPGSFGKKGGVRTSTDKEEITPREDPAVQFLEKVRQNDSPYLDPSDIKKIPLGKIGSQRVLDYLQDAITDIEYLGNESLYHLGLSQSTINKIRRSDIYKISSLEGLNDLEIFSIRGISDHRFSEVSQALQRYHDRIQKLNP